MAVRELDHPLVKLQATRKSAPPRSKRRPDSAPITVSDDELPPEVQESIGNLGVNVHVAPLEGARS